MRLDKRVYGRYSTQAFLYRSGDWTYQPGDKWTIRSYRGKRLVATLEFWGTPQEAYQELENALTDAQLMRG